MVEQRGVALADAWAPGGCVAEVRCASNAGCAMASHALRLEHGFAGSELAVGVADFNTADSLQAVRHITVAVVFRYAVERHAFPFGRA